MDQDGIAGLYVQLRKKSVISNESWTERGSSIFMEHQSRFANKIVQPLNCICRAAAHPRIWRYNTRDFVPDR